MTRSTPAALALACVLLAACGRDLPTNEADRTPPPDAPSRALNPACDSTGSDHPSSTIIVPTTWTRAAGPHRVVGTVTAYGAGRLIIEPGTVVCLGQLGALDTYAGGRITARGLDTARIVFTAIDFADGWRGVTLNGAPDSASVFAHVLMEHVRSVSTAIAALDAHAVLIDSAVLRQNGQAARLEAPGSEIARSRVDTTTSAQAAAVVLGDSTGFVRVAVHGAAGVGVDVTAASGARLMGGRIAGSGGMGLRVTGDRAIADADPVRVTGGAGFPAEMSANAFARVYPALTDQDSLLGNAADTLSVTRSMLKSWAYSRAVLPWRVRDTVFVEGWGILRVQPAGRLVFDQHAAIVARSGGRLVARGIHGYPVVLTAANPLQGWDGILLEGAPSNPSYLTNARVQHVDNPGYGLIARGSHPVVVDSAVFRQNHGAISVWTAGSRISRTRVDTTDITAIQLGGAVTLESTRIRGAGSTAGLQLWDGGVQVTSCEVRESAGFGIQVISGVATLPTVRDCNLVDNGGPGMENPSPNGVVGAEDSWWGDAAGPTGPNGDGVSGLVDYTPWRTSPVVLPYVP